MGNERASEDIVMREARWSWHTLYLFRFDMQLIEQFYDMEHEVYLRLLSLIQAKVNNVKWRTYTSEQEKSGFWFMSG